MRYAKVKRERIGICNLCCNVAPLSWDHVPPKGSYEAGPSEIKTVFDTLTSTDGGRISTRDSQSGLKFRTICKACNEWLGAELDPTYISFSRQIGQLINSKLHLPNRIKISTFPNRLVRAIIAHLLAVKVDMDNALFEQCARKCARNLQYPIPECINIFYWVYPYSTQVAVRDVGMLFRRGHFGGKIMFCHLLKGYPIAFLVTNSTAYESLPSMLPYMSNYPDYECEIEIDLSRVEDRDWPERVDEGNLLIGGHSFSSSVVSSPRNAKC